MARAKGQTIPEDLQDLWGEAGNTKQTRHGETLSIGPANDLFRAKPPMIQSPRGETASLFAAWLTDRHTSSSSRYTRNEFFAARKRELLEGMANPEFWNEATVWDDRVAFAVPSVEEYTDDWPTEYLDPIRLPTRCLYPAATQIYHISEAGTDPSKPNPGWAGAVEGTLFRDLWLAQRRILYYLPRGVTVNDGWPILLLGQVTITANASFRGSRVWFTVEPRSHFVKLANRLGEEWNHIHPKWRRENRFTRVLPEESPMDWTCQRAVKVIVDARRNARWEPATFSEFCGVRIMIPPSLGVYFSRNDWVTATHETDLKLFTAK